MRHPYDLLLTLHFLIYNKHVKPTVVKKSILHRKGIDHTPH